MEFEAIVLCGEGHKLSPITPGVPKALLPVANRPLIEYTLEWCARARFAKTTVAINAEDFDTVATYVRSVWPTVKVWRIPAGTKNGEVLALLASAIDRDFALVPCDLVTASDIDPEQIISAHRAQEEETTLVTGFYYQNKYDSIDKKVLDCDILLHSQNPNSSLTQSQDSTDKNNQLKSQGYLLDSYSKTSIKEAKQLRLRMAMLWKFPKVIASTDILSTGIFLCRRAVLSAIDNDVDMQDKTLSKVIRDLARRTWRHRQRLEGVSIVTLDPSTPIIRVNNVPAYHEATRQLLKKRARSGKSPLASSAGPAGSGGSASGQAGSNLQTTAGSAPNNLPSPTGPANSKTAAVIGNDSIVGEGTEIGERTSVKKTCVGNSCEIGRKCRLTGCILLDGVRLEDDVVLENCIIGQGAVIEAHCRLVGCEIEGNYHVASSTEAKNEVLKGLSMISIEEDGLAVDEDTDDSDDSDGSQYDEEEFSDDGADDFDDDIAGDDFFDRS